jgi:hypothetical protein
MRFDFFLSSIQFGGRSAAEDWQRMAGELKDREHRESASALRDYGVTFW